MDSAGVGIVGKLHFVFPCAVNTVIHDEIASYALFHNAVFNDKSANFTNI